MARIRYLKPEFFTDPDVCALSPLAVLLFQALWVLADRNGRVHGRPRDICFRMLQGRQCDPEALFAELAAHKPGRSYGFIRRYEVAGEHLTQIEKFGQHQKFHPQERASKLPGPPDAGEQPASNLHAGVPQPAGSLPAALGTRDWGLGTGDKDSKPLSAAADAVAEAAQRVEQLALTSEPAAPPRPPAKAAQKGKAKKPEKLPDPRHAPLRLALEADFRELMGTDCGFDGHWAKALSELLAKGSDEAIRAAWRRALKATGYPTVRTLPELNRNWAHFAAAPQAPPGTVPRASASDVPCEACGSTEEGASAWGRHLCYPCFGQWEAADMESPVTPGEWLERRGRPPDDPLARADEQRRAS